MRNGRLSLKMLSAKVVLGAVTCVLFIAACQDASSNTDFCSTGRRPLDWPMVDNSAIMQKYWQGSDLEATVASKLAPTDGSAIADAAKLAVIGRGMSVYAHFDAYMLSFLIEPFVPRIVAELTAGAADANEIARNIVAWAAGNLVHTQQLSTFRDQCGKDPWGGTPSGAGECTPFYKKANPAEMLAKSMYTGKLTGKCEALPSLVAAVFALSGARWDDIVILRLMSHNLGLVRFAGQTYLINNTTVSVVDEATKQSLLANTYFGFSSYSVSVYRAFPNQAQSFSLDESVFSADHSLLENLLLLTGTRAGETVAATGLGAPEGGSIPAARVFTFNPLSRYAYQSLGVSDPESYLVTSAQAPRVRELASQLKDDTDVARWMRDNLAPGSIFEDSAWRIMSAEDVIVFRRGGWKDQALLASALLKRMGYAPEMIVTADNAFVAMGDGRIYEARTWQPVAAVSGPVLLTISPP
jgi:hypothetical protein